MRGRAAVCRVADYSPAPAALGGSLGALGLGRGRGCAGYVCGAGPWAGGLPAAQRRAGGTLSRQPTPGPCRAALGGSTLAPPRSRGASRGGGWSSPVEGQGDGWVGGLPRCGGAWEGAVGVGGWLGGLPQWGGWEGSLAWRPVSSAASGDPGGGLCSLSFPGSLQGQAESPSKGQVPARWPRTSPQPPPHCLHSRAHLLTPITHTGLNLPAHTLTHTHRSQTPSVQKESRPRRPVATRAWRAGPTAVSRSSSGRGKASHADEDPSLGLPDPPLVLPASGAVCTAAFRSAGWAGAGAARLEVLSNTVV